jgi:hypothetical protein
MMHEGLEINSAYTQFQDVYGFYVIIINILPTLRNYESCITIMNQISSVGKVVGYVLDDSYR